MRGKDWMEEVPLTFSKQIKVTSVLKDRMGCCEQNVTYRQMQAVTLTVKNL
jgi:hypothetical protein